MIILNKFYVSLKSKKSNKSKKSKNTKYEKLINWHQITMPEPEPEPEPKPDFYFFKYSKNFFLKCSQKTTPIDSKNNL
ncbi:hypothetical protein BpHYR1_049020 [Brachionus plicatilis]|uniref:Uncharacterized protein n=1 Tax=Brachionus plicatilis TaxID=10195 RepID=A0A3M7RMJ6_BRAPC|nr:hypothetical protein BpHYR1_049020 [Brachionus plicatilis]